MSFALTVDIRYLKCNTYDMDSWSNNRLPEGRPINALRAQTKNRRHPEYFYKMRKKNSTFLNIIMIFLISITKYDLYDQ